MKSRLYTRTGDDGTTSLATGGRALKDSARLQAYGNVDELNSWLGLVAASETIPSDVLADIQKIQNQLFNVGAILASEPDAEWQPAPLGHQTVEWLESRIDEIDGRLEPLRQFILPGGHRDACNAHIARTVARRAERSIVSLCREATVDNDVVRFINRLSDYLFALARYINHLSGRADIPWKKDSV